MRYLLTLGAVFFKDGMFKVEEFGFCDEATWVFGSHAETIWADLRGRHLVDVGSQAFSDAGWYVIRDNMDYLVVSCGPNGQRGNGGHCHNDKLSVEVQMDGEDIFVDPGTYVYTSEPAMRNLFRSTSHHNTVVIDGSEQNDWIDGPLGLFTLGDRARARVTSWMNAGDICHFSGEHCGFDGNGYHHSREITMDNIEHGFIITDVMQGKSARATAFFHCAPGIIPEYGGGSVVILAGCSVDFYGYTHIEIEDYLYSGAYGDKIGAKRLRIEFLGRLETRISKRVPIDARDA